MGQGREACPRHADTKPLSTMSRQDDKATPSSHLQPQGLLHGSTAGLQPLIQVVSFW